MQIQLLLNLGAADAARAGLDPATASAGSVVTVDEATALEFITRCWAVRIPAKPSKPVKVQAVPTIELKAEGNGEDKTPA